MYANMYIIKSMEMELVIVVRREKEQNPNVRAQMVVPSFSTLLSYSTIEHLSNLRPLLNPKPGHQFHQQSEN